MERAAARGEIAYRQLVAGEDDRHEGGAYATLYQRIVEHVEAEHQRDQALPASEKTMTLEYVRTGKAERGSEREEIGGKNALLDALHADHVEYSAVDYGIVLAAGPDLVFPKVSVARVSARGTNGGERESSKRRTANAIRIPPSTISSPAWRDS